MENKLGIGTRLERVLTLTEVHVWPAWCARAQSETERHNAQEERIDTRHRGMDGAPARQRNPRAHTFIHTATFEWPATKSGQTVREGCSLSCACGSTGREAARRTEEGQGGRDEGEGARRVAQLSWFELS